MSNVLAAAPGDSPSRIRRSSVASIDQSGLTYIEPIIWIGGGTETPIDSTTVPVECAPGHILVTQGLSQTCVACEPGTFEVRHAVCLLADSYSYVPRAGLNESGVESCGPIRRVQDVRVE